MLVKLGQYTLIDPNSITQNPQGKGDGNTPGGGGKPKFTEDSTGKEDIPMVGQEKPGISTQRSVTDKTKSIKNKATEYTKKGKSSIYKGKKATPDWKNIAAKAMAKSDSSRFKDMVKKLSSSEPLVNWKKELKKFFDNSFSSKDTVLPNRRFVAGGKYLYGQKPIGKDTLRTIVAAIDTSGSISQTVSNTFIKEVIYLCKQFDADTTYIIYCSDDIDNVDIVKKGKMPDLSKWASTGGNAKGFIPPFEFVDGAHKKNVLKTKINPSIFIYLTDTLAQYPDPKKYGIPKYANKTFWFICGPTVHNKPPFGKVLFAPDTSIVFKQR
jgi:predicted metal-dependent peptidase